MNRAEAAAILSIDPNASPDEARRAYQDLFTEHQVRLTNAPTPALRSLYQARLLELDEAKDVLLAQSLGDADSDLPTDQPSIPGHITREPAIPPATPPPPRVEKQATPPKPPPAAAEPQHANTESADASVSRNKKPKTNKLLFVVGAIAAAIVAWVVIPMALRDRGATAAVTPPSYAERIPGIRENITVAHVEFGRGDYDAANRALLAADTVYYNMIPHAAGDTVVAQIKVQLDSLHGKVSRACEALKKVAERHPGEPTCKTL